jgi:hypothetical protein
LGFEKVKFVGLLFAREQKRETRVERCLDRWTTPSRWPTTLKIVPTIGRGRSASTRVTLSPALLSAMARLTAVSVFASPGPALVTRIEVGKRSPLPPALESTARNVRYAFQASRGSGAWPRK